MSTSFHHFACMKYSGKDGFQRFPCSVTAAGQGHDQGITDGTGLPPAHHRHRRTLLSIGAHGFGYAIGIPLEQFFNSADRIIPGAKPGASGSENEMDVFFYPFL